MKTLNDSDFGIKDCDFVARGESDDEVIGMMIDHLKENHPSEYEKMTGGKDDGEVKKMVSEKVKDEAAE